MAESRGGATQAPESRAAPAGPAGPGRPDPASRARMPLIDLIASGALDEEYGEVARRRPPRAPGSARPRPGAVGAVAVLFFAVIVTIAFQQTRDNESVVDASRATLESRIVDRRADVSRAQDRVVALRQTNNAAESTLDGLEQSTRLADARLTRLRTTTGFSAVTGPGVRVVVGDSPDGLANHRVYDVDLRLLVNGLWEAGAEAVAVNGERVTSLSAFRFSGASIGINKVRLSPPYTVDAIGDERTLLADLLDTSTALRFQARADEFGFTLDMHNEDRLTLPSAPQRLEVSLRSATLAPTDPQIPPAAEENAP